MQLSAQAENFETLRNKFPEFHYDGFQAGITNDGLQIEFSFRINGLAEFRPVSVFHFGNQKETFIRNYNANKAAADNIIFHIGLIELISYWKSTCAPVINIHTNTLNSQQSNWWKKLYFNGLGEFFYINGIQTSNEDFVEIKSSGVKTEIQTINDIKDGYLVPIGGGKDSAVTLELLKRENKILRPLIINPRGATINTITSAGLDYNDTVTISRSIDPELLRLNNLGYLNGHTPFSAMLAFYTLLASLLNGYKNIALSNESSANEVTIPGTNINHQYSKSFEFEEDFRWYYSSFISPSFNYFSFLRPLNELQIVKIFSGMELYHPIFRSCNVGSKTDTWCGKCSKCLFTCIMLSAFKGTEYASRIIGADMLNDTEMIPVFDELTGISDNKPFECVGTLEDVNVAMSMIARNAGDKKQLLTDRFLSLKGISEEKISGISESEKHNLSPALLGLLKKALR
jgi:hypothetical protein